MASRRGRVESGYIYQCEATLPAKTRQVSSLKEPTYEISATPLRSPCFDGFWSGFRSFCGRSVTGNASTYMLGTSRGRQGIELLACAFGNAGR
jgi:hypothetical protein